MQSSLHPTCDVRHQFTIIVYKCLDLLLPLPAADNRGFFCSTSYQYKIIIRPRQSQWDPREMDYEYDNTSSKDPDEKMGERTPKSDVQLDYDGSNGFVPEDLIERLSRLKPSENFELGKFRHPNSPGEIYEPLDENCYEMGPPFPSWLLGQIQVMNDMETQPGGERAAECRQRLIDRWVAVYYSVERELTPFPDLHLFSDMEHSPGGTLFPWSLVQGLVKLREHADLQSDKLHDDEDSIAMAKREKTINCWRERNPDMVLADDELSMFTTWPQDLMDELDEIDREALRSGRRKFVALLNDTLKEMQKLVTFWTDCGPITGQRTPPSTW